VRGLVKEYRDGTRANRGIDLDVRAGEIIAVLGPNGAGKTTLLRQLTTELRPTTGSIAIFGVDAIGEPSRAKKSMGISPQEAGLFETLTVRVHLELFARLKGLTAAAARAAAVATMTDLGLAADADRRVGALSGGQRRRVLIALALLGAPPLLVLDEPTAGLDPASRRMLWDVLHRAVRAGATVIFSTHYMEEAERASDRIAIISAGHVIAFGPLDDLVATIRDRYRLSYRDPSDLPGELRVRRFAAFADVEAEIRHLALSEYSVAPASLEDIYFELAGEPFRTDAPAGAGV
jgi:ABC-type multidrug transport system ATPase subunit